MWGLEGDRSMRVLTVRRTLVAVAVGVVLYTASPGLATSPEEVDRLNYAIADNDLGRVEEILATGINLNAWNEVGLTPLIYAVETFHDERILHLLLESGANVNVQMPRNGKTALMKAASSPFAYTAVPILLEHHADPNLEDKRGYTALWSAIELFYNGDDIDPEVALDNLVLILEHEADPDHMVGSSTPIMLAAQEGFSEVVRVLAEFNATTDLTNDENLTARELALAFEHQDVAEFLNDWEGNATEELESEEPPGGSTEPAEEETAETAEPVG
ncbi:MAG: ankyrin repeat domain-containing protein [Desulfovibrio sp.]|nr:MAG: ankyrin repeat domain-containing protein [Desulfovibrio sp.]